MSIHVFAVLKFESEAIQMKFIEHYFTVVLFIMQYKVVLTIETY